MILVLEITSRANGYFNNYGASIKIAEPLVQAFEPLKTCDDMYLASVGEVMPESAEFKVVTKLRKEAAKEIAEALTRLLIQAMQKDDTHNGYKKDEG